MKWNLFIARRYFRSRRREKRMSSSLFSIAGLAVGVMTLLTVIGVMNGFQYGFIENILEIRSYHVRISGDTRPGREDLRRLRSQPEVEAVVPFAEAQTILQGRFSSPQGALIRGIPPEAFDLDPGMAEKLGLQEGSLDLKGGRKAVLGRQLARSLGLRVGDTVSLMALTGDSFSFLRPEQIEFTVTGIFKSGFYEYDVSLALISLENMTRHFSDPSDVVAGVKLRSRFQEQGFMERLKQMSPWSGYQLVSWRTYNRAFFGALRTEKILMMVVVGLIFVVVSVNIFHMFRKAVQERREEVSLLKAVGGSPGGIRMIFIADGLLIGFLGGVLGVALGLLVSSHINGFFLVLQEAINRGLELVYLLKAGPVPRVSLYSSGAFYMDTIPLRLFWGETVMIGLFAVAASTAAAAAASARISSIKPVQVLRYE